MKSHMFAAALVSLAACANGGDHVIDLVEEHHWQCDDGREFSTKTHMGLGVLVLDAGNRSYTLRPIHIDGNGRMRASDDSVAFEAHIDQAPPFRATGSLRGASGGPYVNCEHSAP